MSAYIPAAVADLIRRGETERAVIEQNEAAKRDRERAAREQWADNILGAVREAVVAADIGLPRSLVMHLELPHLDDPAELDANRYTTATLRLPGCSLVSFNVERGPGGCWVIGRDGEGDPFFGQKAGYGGTFRFPTLPLAVAAARVHWLANQPVPPGLS